MNIYLLLEQAITSSDIEIKETLTLRCLEYCTENSQEFPTEHLPKKFASPSYASICQIVEPKSLPARKDFESIEGLAVLVHAILHIEYSAIDLALDAVYRYPFMSNEYKIDWLEVALDEIRHFQMLRSLLGKLNFDYGDFPVHSGLFDASVHTADNLLDRMAIIPRYFEASGLDVNPQIIKKLHNKRKNLLVAHLVEALEVIYKEEIVHVQKGDKWFRILCEEQGIDAESHYLELLEKYNLRKKHRPHINVEARKAAGFSCVELLELGAEDCKES